MKTRELTVRIWVMVALVAVLYSGCVAPSPPARKNQWIDSRTVQWNDPDPDGYYTGAQPDFAKRFNPDPKKRKFRVAYLQLWLASIEGLVGGADIKTLAVKKMDVFYGIYMGFREQAQKSEAGVRYRENKKVGDANRALLKARVYYEKTTIDVYLSAADIVAHGLWIKDGSVFGEPTPREFARHLENMAFLNAELAARYPNIFTTDESGFPLDLALLGLYTQNEPVLRTRYEGWCVGLPEHADGEGQGVFKPSEAFLDPYDAIAAALFKLTDKQFEGLEPANPNDHNWLEEK